MWNIFFKTVFLKKDYSSLKVEEVAWDESEVA